MAQAPIQEPPIHEVQRPHRLRGEVRVPGDKSISHRALIHNAIADGIARVENVGPGEDVRSTIRCLRNLGVEIEETGRNAYLVHGRGLGGLREPFDILDAGNSGTTTRLLAGVLAAQPFFSVVNGDESLRARPMDRVIEPLRSMGATALGRQGDDFLPMAIRGGNLHGIEYAMPVASAQVKACLLLAGVYAQGTTHLIEPAMSRDHTERLLAAQGADIRTDGLHVWLRGGRPIQAVDVLVAGDTSSAAYWLVAACIHPDAEIVVRDVGLSDGRTGFVDALRAMGADLRITNERTLGGEPIGDISARSSDLHGTVIGGSLIPRLIDEAPILSVAAALAEGDTVIKDAQELRLKESDRIAAVASELGAIGAQLEERADGLVIHGSGRLVGGKGDSHKDHRMAMALAIAGLVSETPVQITGASSVTISYPGFWDDLRDLSLA